MDAGDWGDAGPHCSKALRWVVDIVEDIERRIARRRAERRDDLRDVSGQLN
jgi:hypothetical protein